MLHNTCGNGLIVREISQTHSLSSLDTAIVRLDIVGLVFMLGYVKDCAYADKP